jgi:hypothetical protein
VAERVIACSPAARAVSGRTESREIEGREGTRRRVGELIRRDGGVVRAICESRRVLWRNIGIGDLSGCHGRWLWGAGSASVVGIDGQGDAR